VNGIFWGHILCNPMCSKFISIPKPVIAGATRAETGFTLEIFTLRACRSTEHKGQVYRAEIDTWPASEQYDTRFSKVAIQNL